MNYPYNVYLSPYLNYIINFAQELMNNNPQTFWLENLKLADRYNNWIFEQIKPHLGNKVLEVGCGNGNFTIFLAQQCEQVIGIDINREYVNIAKKRLAKQSGVTLIQGDVTKLETENKFDTIVMLDVLEHIENDVIILQQLNKLLTSGGKLIIKVPAFNYLYGEMDRVIGHYRRYNKNTLINVCKKANLTQPLIWYFNLAGIPGWWLNSKILKRTIPPAKQVSLFNKVVPVLIVIESIVKTPLGLSLFAVIIKPN
jgi:2-polyprenyl-3-methyl-5-hydroxy-6-metoxy-1,4-benzoquinol methylase